MPWWNPFSTDANDGQTAEEIDAKLREREADYQRKHAPDEDRAAQVDAHFDRQEADDDFSTVGDEFARGWHEGEDNIRNTIGSTIKGALGTVYRIVPWWVWLALLAGLAAYIGLPMLAARKARGK